MIKLALTLTVVTVFAVGSALAGSCGGCGDKEKSKDGAKEGTTESHSYSVKL
jgi:hypothetical protein